MPDNQFGFRHNHSTIHAITKLTSDICHKLNSKLCSGAILVDMDKAFESVWLDGLLYKLHKMKFQPKLIEILYEMLYNRKFITTNGDNISNVEFLIHNGLQQGSITAPILFNLYTKELVSNQNLNNEQIQTIAYADDIVIYSANKKIKIIQENLQRATDFIVDFLHTWHIKLNINKCEAILFRRPLQYASRDTKKNWKDLSIHITNTTIEQKRMVKYLGITIDQYCYLNEHINVQLTKARRAFLSNKKIFYSRHIDENVKIIAYQSMVRPILTYGCPVWFNIGTSYMEKLRVFERKCIRHCRGLFRKTDTENLHYISNQSHYNLFKADRIDLHIIHLIRNHILKSTSNFSNSLLYGPYFTDDRILQNSIQKHNIPGPETFIYLDKIGYIQDELQIPVIYHIKRRPNEKGFDNNKFTNPEIHIRFNTSFRKIEQFKYQKQLEKYWWLHDM